MAMDGNALGAQIAGIITSQEAPPEARAQILRIWQQIGGAIVAHIRDNAVVPPGIAVSTPDTVNGATTEPGKVE